MAKFLRCGSPLNKKHYGMFFCFAFHQISDISLPVMENKTKHYVNSQGSTYLALNHFGWSLGSSPWKALANLNIYSDSTGKRINKLNDADFEETSNSIYLWFIADESKMDRIEGYAPVDADGELCGLALYAGDDERNEKRITENL